MAGDRSMQMDAPFGRLAFVRHAARLSETPARRARPSVQLATRAPVRPVRTDREPQ
jgi:hypothetical protein